MTTHTWPADRDMKPEIVVPGVVDRTGLSESPYTGGAVTGEVPFSYRRTLALGWPGTNDHALLQRRVAFLMKIRRAHRVLIPYFPHQAPAGTLRGTPTVTNTTAQGATSIGITTSTSGETVKEGDNLGLVTAIGAQLVTVTADATGSGTALTFSFEPPLRAGVTAGTAVTWNAPTALYMLRDADWAATFRPGEGEPLVVEFVEMWNT